MKGYLKNHRQRINVNNNFNEWETVLTSAARVSILEYVEATNWDHLPSPHCRFNRIYIFEVS